MQVKRTQCKNCIIWAKSDILARDIIRLSSDVTVRIISAVLNFYAFYSSTHLYFTDCNCCAFFVLQVGYIVMNDPSTGARTNLLRIKKAGVVGVYHPLVDEKLVTILHGYEP